MTAPVQRGWIMCPMQCGSRWHGILRKVLSSWCYRGRNWGMGRLTSVPTVTLTIRCRTQAGFRPKQPGSKDPVGFLPRCILCRNLATSSSGCEDGFSLNVCFILLPASQAEDGQPQFLSFIPLSKRLAQIELPRSSPKVARKASGPHPHRQLQ